MEKETIQGRYRIIRTLGHGGLGSVYLCADLRLARKRWAIKRMNPPSPYLAEEFRAAFRREAAILSHLQHPNLPLLVDYFEEEGHAYLVMEYVEGADLALEVRRHGPLGEGPAFRHGLRLLELLAWLHRHDPPVIFGDLRPENLILEPRGDLKLIDFGMAWRLGQEHRGDTPRSGSVAYAAPELSDAKARPDERSDVYSWGATMVFLLTGSTPPARTAPPPGAPSDPQEDLDLSPLPLSPAACRILSRALEPSPADRYPSAEVAARDVAELLAGLPEDRPPADVEARTEESTRPPTASAALDVPSSPTEARRPPEPRRQAPSPRTRSLLPRTWQSLAPPLALLVVATLAFAGALWGSLRPPAPSPRGPAGPTATARAGFEGVSPLRTRERASQNKERGREFYQKGLWTEAIAALDLATTQFPDDSEAWILKQNAYVRLTGAPCLEIPFLGPASGEDRPEYLPHLDGLCIAQEQLNARTDPTAKKVVITLADDESSTSRCLQLAEQLVRDARVRVVLGPTGSQRVLAVAPIFNGAHVSLVSPTASSEQIWSAGPYVFTVSDPRSLRVQALARYLLHAGFSRPGIIQDQTSRLSNEMARTFEEEVRGGGGHPVLLPAFDDSSSGFDAQIEGIEREKPDIVFLADYRVPPLARFAVQLRKRGLVTPLCSQTVPFARELVNEGGAAVDGLLLTDFFHPQAGTPAARAFIEAFERKFEDLTPTYQAANSYDSLMAVVAGLEATRTREELDAWFRSTGVTRPAFEGVGGRFALGRRMDARRVWLIQVSQGRFKLLRELEPAPRGPHTPTAGKAP